MLKKIKVNKNQLLIQHFLLGIEPMSHITHMSHISTAGRFFTATNKKKTLNYDLS